MWSPTAIVTVSSHFPIWLRQSRTVYGRFPEDCSSGECARDPRSPRAAARTTPRYRSEAVFVLQLSHERAADLLQRKADAWKNCPPRTTSGWPRQAHRASLVWSRSPSPGSTSTSSSLRLGATARPLTLPHRNSPSRARPDPRRGLPRSTAVILESGTVAEEDADRYCARRVGIRELWSRWSGSSSGRGAFRSGARSTSSRPNRHGRLAMARLRPGPPRGRLERGSSTCLFLPVTSERESRGNVQWR